MDDEELVKAVRAGRLAMAECRRRGWAIGAGGGAYRVRPDVYEFHLDPASSDANDAPVIEVDVTEEVILSARPIGSTQHVSEELISAELARQRGVVDH